MIDKKLAGVLRCATVSCAGPNRLENQDRTFASVENGYFSIADGMGGHADGALAAEAALSVSREHFDSLTLPDRDRLYQSVKRAAEDLFLRNLNRQNKMGSTLTCFRFSNVLSFAHIGDCRLYICQDTVVQLITEDHNSRNTIAGGQNILTKSLGFEPSVEPQVGSLAITRDLSALLCTDGFYSEVDDDEINTLMQNPSKNALLTLSEQVEARNPQDNYTAMIVWSDS